MPSALLYVKLIYQSRLATPRDSAGRALLCPLTKHNWKGITTKSRPSTPYTGPFKHSWLALTEDTCYLPKSWPNELLPKLARETCTHSMFLMSAESFEAFPSQDFMQPLQLPFCMQHLQLFFLPMQSKAFFDIALSAAALIWLFYPTFYSWNLQFHWGTCSQSYFGYRSIYTKPKFPLVSRTVLHIGGHLRKGGCAILPE